MARTWKDQPRNKYYHRRYRELPLLRWHSAGEGKWWKRAHNKAVRRAARGNGGRERSIRRYATECNWKLT